MKSRKYLSSTRSGFTLIELLVVIAIIAVLATFSIGAVMRVMISQAQKRTEADMQKYASALDQQWKAVLDDARKEFDNNEAPVTALMTIADQDRDRARILWLKMRLRQEFPTTFDEARAPAPGYLQPKVAYATLPSSSASGLTPEQQGAVLLYLALTQSRRGVTFNPDDVGGHAVKTIQVNGVGYKIFADAWGSPITYVRWATDPQALAQLNSPPYSKSGATYKDPLDPDGKLIAGGTWSTANRDRIGNNVLGNIQFLDSTQNRAPYIISYGRDKKPNSPSNPKNDDLFSYRIRVQGQAGN